jgi:hypothetical protein
MAKNARSTPKAPLADVRASRLFLFIVAGVFAAAAVGSLGGGEPTLAAVFAGVAAVAGLIAALGVDRHASEALEHQPPARQIGIPLMIFGVIVVALIVAGVIVAVS